MIDIKDLIQFKKKPISKRTLLLQDICDATGIEFGVLLHSTMHLKDDWGYDILMGIYEDTMQCSSERKWRRIKCAELVRKTKPSKK